MSGIIGGAGSKSGVIGQTTADFEEGNWTPTGTNVVGYASSRYTKIGKCVICYYFYHTSGGTAGTPLAGLPFTSRGTSWSSDGDASMTGTGVVGVQDKEASQIYLNNVLKGTVTWKHGNGAGGTKQMGDNQHNQGMIIYFTE